MITVIIADDDPRVRQDFGTLLDLESDIDVVAVASDGLTAVDVSLRLRPDVVVMDVRMPGIDGIEATSRIRSSLARPSRVIVMTTFDFDDYVLGAVRAGASGFLLKDQAPELLASAVRTVAAGDATFAPRATARLLEKLVRPFQSRGSSLLTKREIEIIRFVALGRSNDEVAVLADIAKSTVKTHLSSIMLKLDLTSRLQIVVWAYEHGVASYGPGADDGEGRTYQS